MTSPLAAILPPVPSRGYHCGASGLSGGTRAGASVMSNATLPTQSSPRARASLSLTNTSSAVAWTRSLEKANTWFHSGLDVPSTCRVAPR